jgi:hypothetical protein
VLLRKNTHTISIFFLFLLALPQLFIIGLQLCQCHVQHEALERLERESLQTVSVNIKEVTWKSKKEVSINGRMFDIKSFKIHQGRYMLTGLYDDKETAIKDLLKKQVSGTDNSFIKLLVLGQSFVTSFCLISFVIFRCFKKRISFFKNHSSFSYKELIIPPPKFSFV